MKITTLLLACAAVLGLAGCDGNTLGPLNTAGDYCRAAQSTLAKADKAVAEYEVQFPNDPIPTELTDFLASAKRLAAQCPAVAAAVDTAVETAKE